MQKKETPSLNNIFDKKKEEAPAETIETPKTESEAQSAITEESVKEKIDEYLGIKNITGTVKIVLSKPIKVNGAEIELTITNSVEIPLIQNIETDLLGHLRKGLNNSSINFNYKITEEKEERRPYTSEEKFKAMAKKNPALLKLADEFGLDTDH